MLKQLKISNYALIDKLDIEFGPGLTIITGETGAGKSIMMGALSLILGDKADEHTEGLFYDIGKWIYLADALDDYDKDVKKKNYNPFVSAYACATRAEMLEKNGEEVDFTFKAVFAQNAEYLKNIRFYFNHDLTDNIILRGLPAATRRVLCGCKDKIKPNKIKYN